MGKRMKKCANSNKDLEDHISQLSDDVLLSILCHLAMKEVTMKEVTRTSVLSHRWEHLWKYITYLDFYEPIKMGMPTYKTQRFVEWVTRVLELHQSSTIKTFIVRFDWHQKFMGNVDKWIDFAIEKKVQSLDLDFSSLVRGDFDNYVFPDPKKFYNINHLQLCDSLSNLYLRSVDVSGEIIEYFLSNCPLLECILVTRSKLLRNLKVSGTSLRLKHLFIDVEDHLKIEISATNLEMFEYQGSTIDMCFKSVPSLVHLSFGGACCEHLFPYFYRFSSSLSQLQTLRFSISDYKVGYIKLLDVPHLPNLRTLVLHFKYTRGINLLGLTSLVMAWPLLENLTLEAFYSSSSSVDEWEVARDGAVAGVHYHLKKINYVGFVGKKCELELLTYLIDNAVALEKVVIDTHNTLEILLGINERTKRRQRARDRIKQLATKLPKRLEFIII